LLNLLEEIINNPERLKKLQNSAKSLAKYDGVLNIVEQLHNI
jgi:hypothetical protein